MQFPDPITYPTIFESQPKETIFLGVKEFPVSFAFYPSPRNAFVGSMIVEQLDTFFTSQDIYQDSTVCLFNKNMQHRIEFLATNADITKSSFTMKFYIDSSDFKTITSGQIQTVNQPAGTGTNIQHIFAISNSSRFFDPYNYLGTDYYPSAYLSLEFHPYVKNTTYTWVDVDLPDNVDSYVTIAPINSYGILDILATVKFNWYSDQARTIPVGAPPIILTDKKLALRFCIEEKGGVFKNAVQIGFSGTAIATSLYSTTTLQEFEPGALHNIYYWGKGELPDDLFYGSVSNIEISDNGLPIQFTQETAVYRLVNELPDIDSSSSSVSSISSSSLSSVSSSTQRFSTTSSISSESSSSMSSLSTTSVSSSSSSSSYSSLGTSSTTSQSQSTPSSASSTTSEAHAYSSSSSESSSTQGGLFSSSSSSIEKQVALYYGFLEQYNNFGIVNDESGNGHSAVIGKMSNPPVWSDIGGIHGGRYTFATSGSTTQYISSINLDNFSTYTTGTIYLWAKLSEISMSNSSCLFAITNGAVEDKTEFILGLSINGSNKKITSAITIDGEVKWAIEANLTVGFVGTWKNFVVVHNGTSPKLYIDGVLYPFSFTVPTYKAFWINALFTASVPASQLIIATTLRNYSPFYTLGFSGEMDEIKVWPTNLSSSAIYSEYLRIAP